MKLKVDLVLMQENKVKNTLKLIIKRILIK